MVKEHLYFDRNAGAFFGRTCDEDASIRSQKEEIFLFSNRIHLNRAKQMETIYSNILYDYVSSQTSTTHTIVWNKEVQLVASSSIASKEMENIYGCPVTNREHQYGDSG